MPDRSGKPGVRCIRTPGGCLAGPDQFRGRAQTRGAASAPEAAHVSPRPWRRRSTSWPSREAARPGAPARASGGAACWRPCCPFEHREHGAFRAKRLAAYWHDVARALEPRQPSCGESARRSEEERQPPKDEQGERVSHAAVGAANLRSYSEGGLPQPGQDHAINSGVVGASADAPTPGPWVAYGPPGPTWTSCWTR